MSALEGPKADATETPHFPKEPEVLGTPSKFFGALRARHITPRPLASGGRARRTFQFSDLVGPHFFAPNQATHTQAPGENFMDFLSDKPGDRFNPRQSILPGARGPREPLAPGRPASSGPWAAGKLWPLGGREPLAPGHLADPPRWSSHGSPVESPASGRDSGRARGDSRGSFWMEWLRIEF